MTDIPEMYIVEAERRVQAIVDNEPWRGSYTAAIRAHAATLQELGWKPLIDEARMAKARKVAVAVCEAVDMTGTANAIRTENPAARSMSAIQAAYNALGED